MTSGADKSVESWSVAEVTTWLEGLQLDAVAPAFKANAVDGSDLVSLSDEDLKGELGCTPLQARKIRTALGKLQGGESAQGSLSAPPSTAAAAPAAATAAPPAAAPAPAVAVGVPASAAAQPALPRIAPADVARYKQLSKRIAELEGMKCNAMLGEAKRSVHYLGQALAEASRPLPKLEEAVAEEQEKLEKIETKWYPGKKLMGEKHHEGKVGEQAEALAAATKARDAQRRRIEEAEAKLGEANKVAAAWQVKVSELHSASREQESLLERVFAAPEWAGREPLLTLARVQADLGRQAGEAQRTASIYGRAQGLMKQAEGKLTGALQALGRTQMMGMLEMGHDMRPFTPRHGPGSLMMDMAQMATVQRANEMVQSAAQDINAARGILPTMPRIEEALLKAAQAGIFQNVLFGGVMSDMMQMAMVRKSMGEVERMAGQARQCLDWVQKNLGAFEGQAAQLRASADAKAAEARAFRVSEMGRAAAAAAAGEGAGEGVAVV